MERERPGPDRDDRRGANLRPVIGISLVSLLVCGLFFPLLITGIGQATMPYQANGELVHLGGRDVGSLLIDNRFNQPVFFHARNASQSASGVDPHIPVQEAYAQIPRISNATGLSESAMKTIVDQNVEGVLWVFGSPYVNVLKLNLILIQTFPSVYGQFD